MRYSMITITKDKDMEINFKGPVMPIDPYSQLAFVEILNIILIAKHIICLLYTSDAADEL